MDQSVKQDSSKNERSMREIAKKLLQKTDVDKLATLPNVLLPLLNICHHEVFSYENLAELLAKDATLTLKVLSQIAPQDKQQSIDLASVLNTLDSSTYKGLATNSATTQFFSRNDTERTEFTKQHWKHAILCANIAQSIARHSAYHNPAEAYTAGLLHDIGQLVLENAYPGKYTATLAQLTEDDLFHNLEYEEFATTHQHVGTELVFKHTGNRLLADAVLYHHESMDKLLDAHPLVKIINLANQLSSTSFNPDDSQVFENAQTMFAINRPLLLEIFSEAMQHVTQSAIDLEIDIDIEGIDGETAKKMLANEQLKQILLAEQVKHIALLDGVHQHLSRVNDAPAQAEIIAQYMSMLFNVSQAIQFMYEADNHTVQAIATLQYPALSELNIPLKPGRSIITDSLLNRRALHTFCDEYTQPTVIDRQITGLTQRDGLICLPMTSSNTIVGALVFGVDEDQQQALWKQLPLLNRFANEIAHTLSATQSNSETESTSVIDQAKLLEARIHEVTHEVGNPLSIINNYLEILSYKLDQDNPAQSEITTIKSEINRVHEIIQRLSEPAQSIDETSLVDINSLITSLTDVFQTSMLKTRDISIKIELDDHIKPLNSNANALKQIYTNLVKNAAEALPANGKIMVYTQDMVNVDGIEHIEISITDNGPGIEASILSKLFSPVNSTKGESHAGLGLSIVRRLVNELNGSISCRSNKRGTSFHILLPKN